MKSPCHSNLRLSIRPLLLSSLYLIFLISIPTQAADPPNLYGVAKERWYIQTLPDKQAAQVPGSPAWDYGLYLDAGLNKNFNDPNNKRWRSRGTTFKTDQPRVNLAMAFVNKETTPQSRWGMEFGLQAGVDTENLVPEPPPSSNDPVSHADTWRHLYRANGTYLFPVGNGLAATAGLINSYIGYESYLAIQNINYTRGYLLDFVPYFLIGAQATYPVSRALDLSLFVVNGWNYLANPNDEPSYGLQATWQISSQLKYIQNLYYGPDQENTSIDYWRFFSDSIIEWKNDRFLLAAALDFGTEQQADVNHTPRYNWTSGALWFGWHIGGPWSMGFRSEFYSDPDGIGTGAEQNIQAYTGTLEYTISSLAYNTFVLGLEYRYDRSTGDEGGFYKGDSNRLVPNQHQLIFSVMWAIGS